MQDIDFSCYGRYGTDIVLDCISTVGAIHKYCRDSGDMVVLDFASFKNPGGRVIDGSKAQEKAICNESYLYNVLNMQSAYYEYNNNHKNRAMHLDRALYSPGIKGLW